MTQAANAPSTNPQSEQNTSPEIAPAAGKGMQDRGAMRQQSAKIGPHDTAKDHAIQAGLLTPNERDQSIQTAVQNSATEDNADPVIAQAAVDAKTDIKDTSKALETDRAYAKLRD